MSLARRSAGRDRVGTKKMGGRLTSEAVLIMAAPAASTPPPPVPACHIASGSARAAEPTDAMLPAAVGASPAPTPALAFAYAAAPNVAGALGFL